MWATSHAAYNPGDVVDGNLRIDVGAVQPKPEPEPEPNPNDNPNETGSDGNGGDQQPAGNENLDPTGAPVNN